MGYRQRLQHDVSAARMLWRAGLSLPSILLYPLRRRVVSTNRIDLRGGLSLSSPSDEPLLFLFREIWVDRCYTSALSLGDVSGRWIVDIGAHVGVFAVWAAATYPQARVLALEPSPVACAYLRRNIAASGLTNVRVAQVACGRPGHALLHSRGPEMMSTLYADPAHAGRRPPVEVEVSDLDEVFGRHGIGRCALLKLDCEGSEYDIVFGASAKTLERIDRIEMECHRGHTRFGPDDLVAHLRRHGFAVATSKGDGIHSYLHAEREPRAAKPDPDDEAVTAETVPALSS